MVGLEKITENKNMNKLVENIFGMNNLQSDVETFNSLFIEKGWCAYGSMSFTLIKKTIDQAKIIGVDEAEKILIDYFSNSDNIMIKYLIYLDPFAKRSEQLKECFDAHLNGNYTLSILLGLSITDGVVDDFTNKGGFFAKNTDLEVNSDFKGIHVGLSKLQKIFSRSCQKTNEDRIEIPYRNGILHGRELNYSNEYVSSKVIALMFAIADWMKTKEKAVKEVHLTKENDSLSTYFSAQEFEKEIDIWKPKKIKIGEDIPEDGIIADYKNMEYLKPVIDFFQAWKDEKYWVLALILEKCFHEKYTDSKRICLCKELFSNKKLVDYKMLEVEEVSSVMSTIQAEANWRIGEYDIHKILNFRVVYGNPRDTFAVPWRNNAEWKINMYDDYLIIHSII